MTIHTQRTITVFPLPHTPASVPLFSYFVWRILVQALFQALLSFLIPPLIITPGGLTFLALPPVGVPFGFGKGNLSS